MNCVCLCLSVCDCVLAYMFVSLCICGNVYLNMRECVIGFFECPIVWVLYECVCLCMTVCLCECVSVFYVSMCESKCVWVKHVSVSVCAYIMYVCVCVSVHECMLVCVSVYVSVCVWMWVCASPQSLHPSLWEEAEWELRVQGHIWMIMNVLELRHQSLDSPWRQWGPWEGLNRTWIDCEMEAVRSCVEGTWTRGWGLGLDAQREQALTVALVCEGWLSLPPGSLETPRCLREVS